MVTEIEVESMAALSPGFTVRAATLSPPLPVLVTESTVVPIFTKGVGDATSVTETCPPEGMVKVVFLPGLPCPINWRAMRFTKVVSAEFPCADLLRKA